MPIDILLISGMKEATREALPRGVDYITLPALQKNEQGQYGARSLGLSLTSIIQLRSQIIRAAIIEYQPDLLIVDNVPRGAVRELDATLDYVKTQTHIRCVLGLRDILDTPDVVQRDWQRAENEAAIRRYYDAIWIYGDPKVYDLTQQYHFAVDTRAKMKSLGYLDQRQRLRHMGASQLKQVQSLNLPDKDFVLGVVGGGQDGADLAIAFAKASLPKGLSGVLITGPFMPLEVKKRVQAIAEKRPNFYLVDYLEEPTYLMKRASRVVAMGGYNTTCEILSFQKKALIVPRVTPRQEQWIRAEQLQKLGLLDTLHPSKISPKKLSSWLKQPMKGVKSRQVIQMNAAQNIVNEVQRLLCDVSLPKAC
ncbi:glycosyltransferase family protein [Lyngbya confervoides]|uniref:Glycosyltransferase n=1 Tax=Lyngbya confervoides BDU141951 TaxID=1574623 RepID=A0ABD4T7D1_9CYAN|nr:glycosyltransferase [Lyngbya confervoides]MCM1984472.1 glycosyltransferase [Lyngbya confervoides BDU141951]